MIVVISHPDDAHAMRVIRCLEERGEPVLLLDLAQLPRHATLTVDYRHLLPEGEVEVFRDAGSGREIVGFSRAESLARSSRALLALQAA